MLSIYHCIAQITVVQVAFGSQRYSHVSESKFPKLHVDLFSIYLLVWLVAHQCSAE